MNSDIALEISKFVCKKSKVRSINQAYNSNEGKSIRKCLITRALESRLSNRVSINHLKSKNIIREKQLDFELIHQVLMKIPHKNNSSLVSPLIVNLGKKIEFIIKKKYMFSNSNE